jgi:poly [ADP-ribose] polymerase 2/3/4
LIDDYIKNTSEGLKLKMLDCYKLSRKGEEKRFKKAIGNNLLLWHGSRLSNFVGILSQGKHLIEITCRLKNSTS